MSLLNSWNISGKYCKHVLRSNHLGAKENFLERKEKKETCVQVFKLPYNRE